MKEQIQHHEVESSVEAALVVSGLSFAYPGGPSVLSDINLDIMRGKRVGLIGPNGAGKTTLFFNICGVLKPSAGEVVVWGKPVVSGKFHHEIGMIFQNADDQLFCPSVRDDVAFGPQNMGLSRDEVQERVAEALAITGVEGLADRPVHHLSVGEKRMVSIAGVLAMQPHLIMYDEPSASLDIRARRRLISFLQASQETIMIAAHDLELILEVCDHVVLVDEGRIIAEGIPREIMGDEQLMEAHGQEKPQSLRYHLR